MSLEGQAKELSVLHHATLVNWWRWRSEEKRMELRKDADLPWAKPPHAVWRIARRLAEKKCRAYLREHGDTLD